MGESPRYGERSRFNSASPSSPCHSLDVAAAPIGDDADGSADDARDVSASLETRVRAVDCPRLLNVQRLASRDTGASSMRTIAARARRARAHERVAPPSSPAPMMQTVDTSQWSILVDDSQHSASQLTIGFWTRSEAECYRTGNEHSMTSLTGKVAFVTGGSRGIGLATARARSRRAARRWRSRARIRAASTPRWRRWAGTCSAFVLTFGSIAEVEARPRADCVDVRRSRHPGQQRRRRRVSPGGRHGASTSGTASSTRI